MLSEVLVLYEDVLAEKFREYGRKREEQKEMERETFQSRLGFLLLSAGCAIGIGNVWKFPYMVGNNGGGIFVLFYLLFLAIMGVPILSMELAIGRGSKRVPCARWGTGKERAEVAYPRIRCPHRKLSADDVLHRRCRLDAVLFLQLFNRKIQRPDRRRRNRKFNEMLSSPSILVITMLIITIAGFLICSVGLQNGVERVTKVMMIVLMVIMISLRFTALRCRVPKRD